MSRQARQLRHVAGSVCAGVALPAHHRPLPNRSRCVRLCPLPCSVRRGAISLIMAQVIVTDESFVSHSSLVAAQASQPHARALAPAPAICTPGACLQPLGGACAAQRC